jgi:hypothetical protein
MNFIHERVINSPGSPNHGVIVKVDFDAPHWNPHTDQFDDAWVTAMMPDGRLGAIEKHLLYVPLTVDLGTGK